MLNVSDYDVSSTLVLHKDVDFYTCMLKRVSNNYICRPQFVLNVSYKGYRSENALLFYRPGNQRNLGPQRHSNVVHIPTAGTFL